MQVVVLTEGLALRLVTSGQTDQATTGLVAAGRAEGRGERIIHTRDKARRGRFGFLGRTGAWVAGGIDRGIGEGVGMGFGIGKAARRGGGSLTGAGGGVMAALCFLWVGSLHGPAFSDTAYDQELVIALFDDDRCEDLWPVVVSGLEAGSALAAADLITLILFSEFTPPGGFSRRSDAEELIRSLVALSIRYDVPITPEARELLKASLQATTDGLHFSEASSHGCFELNAREECQEVLDRGAARTVLKEYLSQFRAAEIDGSSASCS